MSTSPLHTSTRSSIPSAANRIAPAVPSGSSSTANRRPSSVRASGKCGLERVREVAERQHDLVDAVRANHSSWRSRNGGSRSAGAASACVRERPEACALSPDEDDRSHGLARSRRGGRRRSGRSSVVDASRRARRLLAQVGRRLVGDPANAEQASGGKPSAHPWARSRSRWSRRPSVVLARVAGRARRRPPRRSRPSGPWSRRRCTCRRCSTRLVRLRRGTGPRVDRVRRHAPPGVVGELAERRVVARLGRDEGVGVDQPVAVRVDPGVLLAGAPDRLLERGNVREPLATDVHPR